MPEAVKTEAVETPTPRGGGAARIVVLVVILLAMAGGAVAYWMHGADRESTDDAQIDGSIHPLSARVGGTVTRVAVHENELVKAGDVLVEIDPQDFQIAVDRAKADLAEVQARLSGDTVEVPIVTTTTTSQLSGAQAGVAEVRAAIGAAEKQVEAAQARKRSAEALVRAAQANSDRAGADFERMKALLAKDEISRQQYDAAVAAAQASRAQLDATHAQVAEAEQAILVAQSQLLREHARLARSESDVRAAASGPQQVSAIRSRAASTSARVDQLKAALASAQLNLSRTVVRAPVSGVVSQKNVELGQIVQPGQPLLAVVPGDEVWVTANFKESQLARMRVGQKVVIEVDAFGGREYRGTVQSMAAATGARFSLLPPENATGNYVKVVQRVPVKIVFDAGEDREHQLRPGLSVVPTVLFK